MVKKKGTEVGMVNLDAGEEAGYITLEPNYPMLARWFAENIAKKSFDSSKGKQFLAGYTDIIRYLTATQPAEVMKLLAELNEEPPVVRRPRFEVEEPDA